MKKETLGFCPVCEHKLHVKTLNCTHCNTEITGQFSLNKFSYLTKEQLYFIEIFIKNRGSIKEVEKDLGVSYPTVRRMLDESISALGYTSNNTNSIKSVNKKDILAKLNQGEITVDEATELLKGN